MDWRGIAILCACGAATVTRGQYDSSVWPAWQHVRATKTQTMQNYSGTVERCAAVGVSLPAAPTWWRGQRAALKSQKSALKAALASPYHYYIDVAANTNLITTNGTVVKLTWTIISERERLPLNGLDQTPFRCLSGLGPLTNDVAAVGHAHGWTNAWTQPAVAGTNYPDGRDCWYTTDYGVDLIKAAMPYFQDTCIVSAFGPGYSLTSNRSVTNASWSGALSAAAAVLNVATNWTASASARPEMFLHGWDDGVYHIEIDSADSTKGSFTNSPLATIGATNRHSAVLWTYFDADASSTAYYDFLGLAAEEGIWYPIHTDAIDYARHHYTGQVWVNPAAAALPDPGIDKYWQQQAGSVGKWIATWEFNYE